MDIDDWLIPLDMPAARPSRSSVAGNKGPAGPQAADAVKAEPKALKYQRPAKLTPQESQKLRRARKKQWVASLEAEAREKAEELERLLQENSLLHSKSRVLQAVVDDRVEHLGLLQQLNAMSLTCSTSSKPKEKVSNDDAVAAVSNSGSTGMTLFGLVDAESDAQSLLLPVKDIAGLDSPVLNSTSARDRRVVDCKEDVQRVSNTIVDGNSVFSNAIFSNMVPAHAPQANANRHSHQRNSSMELCYMPTTYNPHPTLATSTSYSQAAAAPGMTSYGRSSSHGGGGSPVAVAAACALAPCPIEGARAQLADALPRLSALLKQEGQDEQLLPDAAAQVTTIMGDLLGLMRGLEALDPLAYRQLLASNLATGAEEVPKQAHFWKRVAAAMRLSESQCRDLRLCADVYATNMEKIVAERRRLLSELRTQEGSNATAFIAAPAPFAQQQADAKLAGGSADAAAAAAATAARGVSSGGVSTSNGGANSGVTSGAGVTGGGYGGAEDGLLPLGMSNMSEGSGINSDDDLLAWLDDAVGGPEASLDATLDATLEGYVDADTSSSQRMLQEWGLDDMDIPMSWAAVCNQRGGAGGKRAGSSSMNPKCFSFGGHAGSYMDLLPLTERIDRNLMQEYSQTAMCDGAFSRLVDRVQLARALVAAWPYAPSALDILTGVQQL